MTPWPCAAITFSTRRLTLSNSNRGRNAEGGFFFPRPLARARGLGLVHGVEAEKHPVGDELGVGMHAGLELEIRDALAARLVDAAPHRLGRERDGDRGRRATLDEQIAQLAEQAAEAHRMAIVETGDVLDVVGVRQGSKLDLNELRWRVLEFELGLRGEEPAVALAERRDRFRGELLLALKADARALGEAEDVFGLDLAKRVVVVGGDGMGTGKQESRRTRTSETPTRERARAKINLHRTSSIRGVQGPAIKASRLIP